MTALLTFIFTAAVWIVALYILMMILGVILTAVVGLCVGIAALFKKKDNDK